MKQSIKALAEVSTAQNIATWLLILKPGQCMDLEPGTFGVKAETIQSYVHAISLTGSRRYKTVGATSAGLPVGVRFLGDRE